MLWYLTVSRGKTFVCSILRRQYTTVQSLLLCSLMKRNKKIYKIGTSQSRRYLLYAGKKPDSTLCCICEAIEMAVAGYKLFPFVYANKNGENPRRLICRISYIFKTLYEKRIIIFILRHSVHAAQNQL